MDSTDDNQVLSTDEVSTRSSSFSSLFYLGAQTKLLLESCVYLPGHEYVQLCVCVCLCACACTCVPTCIHVNLQTCKCICTLTCEFLCICTHVCIHNVLHVYMWVGCMLRWLFICACALIFPASQSCSFKENFMWGSAWKSSFWEGKLLQGDLLLLPCGI